MLVAMASQDSDSKKDVELGENAGALPVAETDTRVKVLKGSIVFLIKCWHNHILHMRLNFRTPASELTEAFAEMAESGVPRIFRSYCPRWDEMWGELGFNTEQKVITIRAIVAALCKVPVSPGEMVLDLEKLVEEVFESCKEKGILQM